MSLNHWYGMKRNKSDEDFTNDEHCGFFVETMVR